MIVIEIGMAMAMNKDDDDQNANGDGEQNTHDDDSDKGDKIHKAMVIEIIATGMAMTIMMTMMIKRTMAITKLKRRESKVKEYLMCE